MLTEKKRRMQRLTKYTFSFQTLRIQDQDLKVLSDIIKQINSMDILNMCTYKELGTKFLTFMTLMLCKSRMQSCMKG